MVDFTEAQVGGPQGSPVTVQAPVQDRSIEQGLNLFSNIVSSVGKSRDAQREVEAEGVNNQMLADFTQQNLKLAQAVDQGTMSSSKARTLMRVNMSTFISDNPALREDAFKAHKGILSGAGLGKVVSEGTRAERMQMKLEDSAASEGWVAPDMTPSERAEGVQDYLDAKEAKRILERTQAEATLSKTQLGISKAELDYKEKQRQVQSREALGQTASAWASRASKEVAQLNRQVEQGTISRADAEQQLLTLESNLKGEVSRLGAAGGTDYLNAIVSPITSVYQNGRELVSGRASTKAAEEAIKSQVAIAKTKLFRNPNAAKIIAGQSLSKHSDVVNLSEMNDLVTNFMKTADEGTDAPPNLVERNSSGEAKTYLNIMKDNYKAAAKGALGEDEGLVETNVNNILNSLPTYESSLKNPEQIAGMVNHFASPEFGAYMSKSGAGLDKAAAKESVRVLQSQILNAIDPEIRRDYTEGYKISGNPKSRVNPLPPTDVAVAVMPSFTNGSFMFVPRAEYIDDPDVQAKASRLTKDLSPAINKMIKAASHLEGHKEYATTYQNLLPALFPNEAPEEQLSGKVIREAPAQDSAVKEETPVLEGSAGTREDSLKESEGVRYESYKDTKGFITGGIGHLMSPEEIKKYPEGTKIPEEVVEKWFKEDVARATRESEDLLKEKLGKEVPEEVKDIIFDMTFNMGKAGVAKFEEMFKALKEGNYQEAAFEMLDSKWASDVKGRARGLARKMMAISNKP